MSSKPPPLPRKAKKPMTANSRKILIILGIISIIVFSIFIISCFLLLILQSTDQSNAKVQNKRIIEQVEDISWPDYAADCGGKAQKSNEARAKNDFETKYKNKLIEWTGQIYSIDTDSYGNKAHSKYKVRIKMQPSDSIYADVVLYFDKKHKAKILQMNKHDKITFKGRITSLGGVILDHRIFVKDFQIH